MMDDLGTFWSLGFPPNSDFVKSNRSEKRLIPGDGHVSSCEPFCTTLEACYEK